MDWKKKWVGMPPARFTSRSARSSTRSKQRRPVAKYESEGKGM